MPYFFWGGGEFFFEISGFFCVVCSDWDLHFRRKFRDQTENRVPVILRKFRTVHTLNKCIRLIQ